MTKEQLEIITDMYNEVQYYHKVVREWLNGKIEIDDSAKYTYLEDSIQDVLEEIEEDSKRALLSGNEDDSKYWDWLKQDVAELGQLNYQYAHCFKEADIIESEEIDDSVFEEEDYE